MKENKKYVPKYEIGQVYPPLVYFLEHRDEWNILPPSVQSGLLSGLLPVHGLQIKRKSIVNLSFV